MRLRFGFTLHSLMMQLPFDLALLQFGEGQISSLLNLSAGKRNRNVFLAKCLFSYVDLSKHAGKCGEVLNESRIARGQGSQLKLR